jgi:uncharacterized protein
MIDNRLSEALARVAEAHGIRLALLFGSAASGRLHENSDIDVAVLVKSPDLPLSQFSELYHELQSAVPERKVDLSFLNRADPLFLKKIMESCSVLYGDERELQQLKIYAFKRYQDYRRFLDFERKYARQFVRDLREKDDRPGTHHAQDHPHQR